MNSPTGKDAPDVPHDCPIQDPRPRNGRRACARGRSADTALYPGNGSPNIAGWIAELAYVPGGKIDSWLPTWINVRVSLQYTAYTEFDCTTRNAYDNNSLYALLWLAF